MRLAPPSKGRQEHSRPSENRVGVGCRLGILPLRYIASGVPQGEYPQAAPPQLDFGFCTLRVKNERNKLQGYVAGIYQPVHLAVVAHGGVARANLDLGAVVVVFARTA